MVGTLTLNYRLDSKLDKRLPQQLDTNTALAPTAARAPLLHHPEMIQVPFHLSPTQFSRCVTLLYQLQRICAGHLVLVGTT